VRLIFQKYVLDQKGTTVIARELRQAGYRTSTGNTRWSSSHLLKILKNEKYVGDLVQKKTYTPDYLTHQKKYNHGQEELVVLRDHHEPIVSRRLWEQAQQEIRRRDRHGQPGAGHSNRYVFSGKIKCGCCGSSFVSRKRSRADGSSYKRWSCYRAVSEGAHHIDSQGCAVGCSVGRSIRDELALELLRRAILDVAMDREKVAEETATLALEVLGEEWEDAGKLERETESLARRKEKLLDAYLAGDLGREEMLEMKAGYDGALEELERRRERLGVSARGRKAQIEAVMDEAVYCRGTGEALYRHLLHGLEVFADGRVAVRLRGLDARWCFCAPDRSGGAGGEEG